MHTVKGCRRSDSPLSEETRGTHGLHCSRCSPAERPAAGLSAWALPLSTCYEVTGAEVFEPCFYLTENDLNPWVKGRVCSKNGKQCARMRAESISYAHLTCRRHNKVTKCKRIGFAHRPVKRSKKTQNHLLDFFFFLNVTLDEVDVLHYHYWKAVGPNLSNMPFINALKAVVDWIELIKGTLKDHAAAGFQFFPPA